MPSIINATTTNGLVTSADNSGSLQLATNSGTTAVTVDTAQNVRIGSGNPAAWGASGTVFKALQVGNATSIAGLVSGNDMQLSQNAYYDGSAWRYVTTNPAANYQMSDNVHTWRYAASGTAGASLTWSQAMSIDGLGRIGINSAPAAWIGNEQIYVAGTSSLTNQFVGNIAVTSSSPSGACALFLNYTASAPNNTSTSYLICNDNSGVSKLNIFSNGTVSNRTGTYNSLSDAKLKENIVDATPKLDKLMQVQVRNYNLIGDELKQIGFVAQELEQIFPSLIDNVPDFDKDNEPTGEVTKGVKLTVLIPILVKAIQELNAKVDAQAAEIQALKGVA